MGLLNLRAKDLTVLRQAKPVLFTVLINKVGAIGISLVPILLVERHLADSQSSAVMGSMRFTGIFGILSSGWLIDRVGARFTVLCALLFSAAGLGLLPFAPTAFLIAACGILAQYGDGLMRVAFRVQLTDTVPYENHKEALGWMRTANNLGQILSFSLGSVAGVLGTTSLFVMDSLTSVAAFFFGRRILPPPPVRDPETPKPSSAAAKPEHLMVFVICALIFTGYTFFYEVFMSSTAGRLELLYPGQGLRFFSLAMIVNVVICTALSVPASRFFKRPSVVFPIGLLFTFLASVLATGFAESLPLVFLGATCISAAEVAMMSLTQFTLIRLTPHSKHSTTWYSAGQTVSHAGRILGAAIAFPWFVQKQIDPLHYGWLAVIWAVLAAACLSVRRALDRATSEQENHG